MGLPLLGSLLQGGMGLYQMAKGGQQMRNIGNDRQSEEELRQPFQKSQGLLDRMTNFNQYSGQAMDLASQEGNQGVESAAMMGMGGSQANAIKNRMKRSAMTDVYNQYNQGLKGTLQSQMGLDNRISGLLGSQRDEQRQINMGLAGTRMGIGSNIMGGAKGMAQLGTDVASGGSALLKGLGGLFGWGK